MIVDGRYVQYDEKGSAKIQVAVNHELDLKNDLKSGVKPLDILNNDQAGVEYSNSTYSLFGDDNDNRINSIENRKTRYGYYREMDQTEFIHRGIEIVADDSTQSNPDGDVMKIMSNDEGTKDTLTDLFVERLDFNNELWSIFYETVKMGDNFYEIVPDDYKKPKKIVYIKYLDPDKVVKIEKNGRISHYEYHAEDEKDLANIDPSKIQELASHRRGSAKGSGIIFKLQPWQVVHFKITDKEFDPYGGSLLKSGVRTWRRLTMLEDVILVYRISRAPERRVFYIDVGQMNNTDAKRFMQKIKNQYRTSNFIDDNGNINKKNNVMSITSDIFVPTKDGGNGTKIETLRGGEGLKTIEDLKYFRDKILRTMNIPPAYLGEEADRSKGSLSSLDIKFGRFIERIQAQVLKGINKIAALELFFAGEKKENLANFKIELTPPSSIKEIADIDIITQKMNLIQLVQGLQIFSNEYILKNFLKLSDKEVADISLQKSLAAQNQQVGADGMPVGGGGIPGIGAGGGALVPGLPGAEGEFGAPPVGGAIPPAIGAGTPQELAASTLVNILGKDFLVENSDDFFGMMKQLKEDGTRTEIPMFETISEIINAPMNTKSDKLKADNLRKQLIIGEFAGLEWEEGFGKSIKLFEKIDEETEEDTFVEYDINSYIPASIEV